MVTVHRLVWYNNLVKHRKQIVAFSSRDWHTCSLLGLSLYNYLYSVLKIGPTVRALGLEHAFHLNQTKQHNNSKDTKQGNSPFGLHLLSVWCSQEAAFSFMTFTRSFRNVRVFAFSGQSVPEAWKDHTDKQNRLPEEASALSWSQDNRPDLSRFSRNRGSLWVLGCQEYQGERQNHELWTQALSKSLTLCAYVLLCKNWGP